MGQLKKSILYGLIITVAVIFNIYVASDFFQNNSASQLAPLKLNKALADVSSNGNNNANSNANNNANSNSNDYDNDGYDACTSSNSNSNSNYNGSLPSCDCDDTDSNTYPGADEMCDGTDNNCDGSIDEGFSSILDTCNNIDDDCDGSVDENTSCDCPTNSTCPKRLNSRGRNTNKTGIKYNISE